MDTTDSFGKQAGQQLHEQRISENVSPTAGPRQTEVEYVVEDEPITNTLPFDGNTSTPSNTEDQDERLKEDETEQASQAASSETSNDGKCQQSSDGKTTEISDQCCPQEQKPAPIKEKDDDKLTIYKALAIKLKKELIKTRDELQRLRNDYQTHVSELREKLSCEQDTLNAERLKFNNTNLTQDALIKSLQTQLSSAESDLQAVQSEFENYKTRATQIMQKNNPVQLSMRPNLGFEEDRHKQLRQLNEDYKSKISALNDELGKISRANCDLKKENRHFKSRLEQMQVEAQAQRASRDEFERLMRENSELKAALNQYSAKQQSSDRHKRDEVDKKFLDTVEIRHSLETSQSQNSEPATEVLTKDDQMQIASGGLPNYRTEKQTSPSTSSIDSYMHIKPAALEIVSKSSALEDAQKQIDELTKAYLDSESTNSLLAEQVCALKEEIRRVQRGNERMGLADNLEYLKNVVFKFLSLDSNQTEQKQRLIPVLSTVLRLSPEETAKLNDIAVPNLTNATKSLFRLG